MVDSWNAAVPGVAKRHNLVNNNNSGGFNSYAYHHTCPNPQKALKIKLGEIFQKLNKKIMKYTKGQITSKDQSQSSNI